MSPGAETSPPRNFKLLLAREAAEFGLVMPDETTESLARFLSELDGWRKRINLTGPLAGVEIVRHVLESALGAKLIAHGARVLDIGSGAGLPGLPLAICRPDLTVTLLEPRGKRAAFLRHAIRSVPVGNATVRQERVESVSGPYDAATVRAVGGLDRILGGTHFLMPRGALLAWTAAPDETARSLSTLFLLEGVEPVPGSRRRSIALFRKRPGEGFHVKH